MKLLSIETSCDETGISVLDVHEQDDDIHVEIIANELASQAGNHEEYGGVFPTLAKRLHGQNFTPLFKRLCQQVNTKPHDVSKEVKEKMSVWLKRHDGLADKLQTQAETGLPDVDYIAVTVGPGLMPALWVGINIARSLALMTDLPLLPVNHMAGHLISAKVPESHGYKFSLKQPKRPSVALLVSGGHTELIKESADGKHAKIGQTRDDAAGEAFDKVGRLIGLPYPAGPEVSRLAKQVRNSKPEIRDSISLPRPMLTSDNLDFSFAGLKTAAVRLVDTHKPLDDGTRAQIAYELESAIVDVLITKTKQAVNQENTESILAGGGVVANPYLRERLQALSEKLGQKLFVSPLDLATDNAVMIGLVAGQSLLRTNPDTFRGDGLKDIEADSRLSL
jgi:N6-L-threonylcarbamoyladenine synthase